MPWIETCRVNERMQFLSRLHRGERMTDLCAEFQISRKTGYKLKKLYEELGPDALLDQSRRPKKVPHRTSEPIRELILEARGRHPTWGPKKIKAALEAREEGLRLPAASTIGQILKDEGLVKSRRRRRKQGATPTNRRDPAGPNDLWCADFKGQFQLGNGRWCYPLTITDAYSRYVIACVALDGTKGGPAQTVFEEAFREYGLPCAIRTDNGAPFASAGLGGLTTLSAWWLRYGIVLERIQPGHPEQNGSHERMHRTLKAETARPAARTLLEQQERFDRWRRIFNFERPHEALGQRPPATLYGCSERPLEPLATDYPLHDFVANVSSTGSVWLPYKIVGKRCVYLTTALAGQPVGLREVEDGRWLVSFMGLTLGYLDPEIGFDPSVELL